MAQTAATNDTTAMLNLWRDAIGGQDTLQSIALVHMQGTVEAGGLKGTLEEWCSADGRRRQDIDLSGVYRQRIVVHGPNRQGWQLDQNGKVRELAGSELKDEITETYLRSYSHLLPNRLPGSVEYLTTDESGQHHVVRCLPEGGQAVTFYIDPSTHLPLRSEQPEAERMKITYLSDWRDVDGLKLPFAMRQSTGDTKYDVVVHVQAAHIVEDVDASIFDPPQDAPADFRFSEGHSAIGIPFEVANNHIHVYVRLNQSEPLSFILDTGAEVSVMNQSRADALGLQSAGQLEGRGAGEGSVDVSLLRIDTLDLPGVQIVGQTIAAMPFDALASFEGRAIDGILGYDFISRFVVEIDYMSQHINLFDPRDYRYNGNGESIPIVIEGGSPYVSARVTLSNREPLESTFLIDTGARGALALNKPFIDQHRLLDAVPETIVAPFGVGVGGETKQTIGRVDRFQLGSFTFEQIITVFSQAERGADARPDRGGAIGGDLLRRFKAIFDYGRGNLILEPNKRFGEPFEYDMSGLFLIAVNGELKVHRIVEPSPASEAGVQSGDVIVAIDDRPSGDLTLDAVNRTFRLANDEHVLTLQRGEEKLQAIIKTRRLI